MIQFPPRTEVSGFVVQLGSHRLPESRGERHDITATPVDNRTAAEQHCSTNATNGPIRNDAEESVASVGSHQLLEIQNERHDISTGCVDNGALTQQQGNPNVNDDSAQDDVEEPPTDENHHMGQPAAEPAVEQMQNAATQPIEMNVISRATSATRDEIFAGKRVDVRYAKWARNIIIRRSRDAKFGWAKFCNTNSQATWNIGTVDWKPDH